MTLMKKTSFILHTITNQGLTMKLYLIVNLNLHTSDGLIDLFLDDMKRQFAATFEQDFHCDSQLHCMLSEPS